MIRIWIYDKMIRYYKYCRDRWKDVWYETRSEQAKKWAVYYSTKYLLTIKKRAAFNYYISIKIRG